MTTSVRSSLGERLVDHVSAKAASLQARYRNNDSTAVAELAILRRGVSQRVGEDAALAGSVLGGLYENPAALPDEVQPAERAAYAALTLFAVHQQSHRGASMHRPGYSLGRSARLLGRHSGAQDAVRRRFTALATATTWDETMHHARGLVQQLRAFGIPLDYGRFARDLLDLQSQDRADRVRLVWGRHFYRVRHAEDDAESDGGTVAETDDTTNDA
ncbi:type I-E CRISPR-associated protein Cse2/CasB [Microbacterium sp.]|uniref:type I-E CRISPR-associated protein Cse2/CasB n=1 Tax=Microbacterium sp. TaxID=51671 RepID=UPI0039E5BD6C